MNHGRLINQGVPPNPQLNYRFDAAVGTPAPVKPQSWEVWLPEPFEPRYEYPLLVLLHDNGGDELSDRDVANVAASQNMIVVSVRAPYVTRDGFAWSADDAPIDGSAVWNAVNEELASLPPELNFHPGRVFLAGRGAGAVAAWRAWLAHSDRFAGAALVAPPSSPDADVLRQTALQTTTKPALDGRLWIGGHSVSPWRATARSAYALGAEVSLDPTAESSTEVGRSLERWVMRALPTAVFA